MARSDDRRSKIITVLALLVASTTCESSVIPTVASTIVDAEALVNVPSNDITRDYHGDIFRDVKCDAGGVPSCGESAAPVPGHECKCQCAPSHQVYREDTKECIQDIYGK